MTNATDRESVPEPPNPIGMDGIEFIEFTTSRPQALGGVLERMGFRPVARHRSREVELYRQGSMNIVINSQATDIPRTVEPIERPIISALAVRVRDADAAYRKALDLGAWEIPIRARALELNIPGIHGVGVFKAGHGDSCASCAVCGTPIVPQKLFTILLRGRSLATERAHALLGILMYLSTFRFLRCSSPC